MTGEELSKRTLLKNEFERVMKEEEIKWRQRSRCQWLKEGDKNIKFFRRMASSRLRRNHDLKNRLSQVLVNRTRASPTSPNRTLKITEQKKRGGQLDQTEEKNIEGWNWNSWKPPLHRERERGHRLKKHKWSSSSSCSEGDIFAANSYYAVAVGVAVCVAVARLGWISYLPPTRSPTPLCLPLFIYLFIYFLTGLNLTQTRP